MTRALPLLVALCALAAGQQLEPPAPSKPARRRPQSAMVLSKEGAVDPEAATYDGSPRLPGAHAPVRLGVTGPKLRAPIVEKDSGPAPRLFERAPIAADSPALARETPESPDTKRPVDPLALFAVIAAFFAVAYVVLARALRRGPGGRGLTHD